MRRLGVLIATVGGAGYFPVAPGTVGSAVGLVVYMLTRNLAPASQVALLVAISGAGSGRPVSRRDTSSARIPVTSSSTRWPGNW